MATVVITATAARNLRELIRSHSLPNDTRERVVAAVEVLGHFPFLGPTLPGRWEPFRILLGPWRWMIVVYGYDAGADHVSIITIQDGRSAQSLTM